MNQSRNLFLSIVLPLLAILIAIVGLYGPMAFAATHTNLPAGRYLLCMAGGTVFLFLSLGIAMAILLLNGRMVFKRPIRTLRTALQYWLPKRLTLGHHPRIYAWLWWNY